LEPDVEPAQADLHTHTSRSDGLLEPVALAAAARAAGVRLLAITDHDTLAAYRELRGSPALPPDLELVAGVEINTVSSGDGSTPGEEIHVLGFGLDADDARLEEALASQREHRAGRFQAMLARLRTLGLGVDEALEAAPGAMGGVESLGRPTVARAMVRLGHASSVEDAFDRWLSRGRPAYVPRDGLDPLGAIRTIRQAGGIPVLAHYPEALHAPAVVRELAEAGLGGLESYYRTFDRDTAASMARLAGSMGLLATGGTDYHGDLGPYANAHAELWFPVAAGATVGARLRDATTEVVG
jgi:hypothetical protein